VGPTCQSPRAAPGPRGSVLYVLTAASLARPPDRRPLPRTSRRVPTAASCAPPSSRQLPRVRRDASDSVAHRRRAPAVVHLPSPVAVSVRAARFADQGRPSERRPRRVAVGRAPEWLRAAHALCAWAAPRTVRLGRERFRTSAPG
jgi:hypothetical protein